LKKLKNFSGREEFIFGIASSEKTTPSFLMSQAKQKALAGKDG
jgi:hypothetical protein